MRKSLGFRILFLFVSIIVCPLLITLYITDNVIKNMTLEENKKKLEIAHGMVVNYLKSKKLDMQIKAKKASDVLSWEESLDELAEGMLKEFDFSGVMLVDGTNESELGEYFDLPQELKQHLLISSEKKQWHSVDYIDSYGKLLIIGVSPVSRLRGKNATLICISRTKPYFIDPLYDLTKMQIEVYDREFNTLAGTIFRDGVRVMDRASSENLQEIFSASGLTTRSEVFEGQEHLVGYKKISEKENFNSDMYVMVGLPKEVISQTNKYLLQHLTLITIIAICLASLVAFLLARHIVVPLRIFSRAAKEIANGDFDFKITLDREDEIGVLVNSFNEMTRKLKNTYNELKRKIFEISTLYRISQIGSFETNSDELLKRMLSETCTALKSERASIFLLNSENDVLELQMVVGVDEEKPEQRIFLKAGEGIAGRVIEQGEGIINNEGNRHVLYKAAEDMEERITLENMMCVPLKFKDRSFGVINVSNKAKGEMYDDSDFHLLKALASRIAVNIENTRLYELSITDGLTKLFVHRYFQVRLEEEVIRARRYDSRVSLLMFDIDHFKSFNDTYGHQTGDLVLMEVAEIIQNTIRQNIDIPARYGGEEFAVIFPEMGLEDAVKLAERLRAKVEETSLKTSDYGDLKVTVSIGVATYPDNADNRPDLIAQADQAMYQAKSGGRNMVVRCEKKSP